MSTALPAAPTPAARRRPWAAVVRAGLHVSSLRWADLGLPPPPASRQLTFGTTFRVCAVCLDEYVVGDRLRVLEPCNHCFHTACIDRWARVSRRPTCPVCSAPAAVPAEPAVPARCARQHQAEEEVDIMRRRARVQLIDLSVHDSWIEWFAGLIKGRVPQERPPLSLALPAD